MRITLDSADSAAGLTILSQPPCPAPRYPFADKTTPEWQSRQGESGGEGQGEGPFNERSPGKAILLALLIASGCVAALLAPSAATAEPRCRMEQQCHWVNFKKVCTWVRVCR